MKKYYNIFMQNWHSPKIMQEKSRKKIFV